MVFVPYLYSGRTRQLVLDTYTKRYGLHLWKSGVGPHVLKVPACLEHDVGGSNREWAKCMSNVALAASYPAEIKGVWQKKLWNTHRKNAILFFPPSFHPPAWCVIVTYLSVEIDPSNNSLGFTHNPSVEKLLATTHSGTLVWRKQTPTLLHMLIRHW